MSVLTSHTKAALLVLVLCMLALTIGCSKESGERRHAKAALESADPAQKQQQDLLAKYELIVKNAKEAASIVSFLNENMVQANRQTADTMLRELNAYYEKDLQKSQEAFLNDKIQDVLMKAEWPITSANIATIPDDKVKQLVATKLSGGYRLVMVEGMIYPIVDYEMQKTYRKKLSDDLNAFIAIQAQESNEPAAMDAGLVIPWDELADRAVEAEHFIKQFPVSPERASVQQLYKNDMSMYILGLTNTPVFNPDTFQLTSEVKASYERTESRYKGTLTAHIASQFVKVLESSDWKVYDQRNGEQTDIPQVKSFRDSFLAEIDSMLPSF
ncbi:hypothetical protein [Paenibacillus protaetiae]|uniref:Uncharacterized protein n=1 Tax=Paenibacillus protaetiae TaxID=2509456 RepID=A0A4P6EVI2_9BACL|nr:hypothetical protein [Paenibacillus protaetiae]QAY66656.1 hypothetical protein ET464_09800 [Paenibacillus protaetiae]